MIEIEHISKSFDDKQVLYDISGRFDQGKTNLIIGASGTGKTVLLKCIVGLIVPDEGNVFYNGYWATRSLLEAIEKAGTTNNHAVIKELEQLKIPADVRMQHHDAYMNAKTHQMQQTIYLAKANLKGEEDDMFTIVTNTSPEDAVDAGAEQTCKLESFEETPVYEP